MNRQFPPEIVQLIVEASLDHYDLFHHYNNDPEPRYATLTSYSLLNSTWCGASQAELVQWVEVCTEESAIRFLELVQQRGGTVGGVRDVFVDSAYSIDPSTVVKLLRCAPQVTNLRLYRTSVDVEDLAQLQQLRRLELDGCSIAGSTSSSLLRLPQLQRLYFYNCQIEHSACHLLTPAFLPRLRHVDTNDPAAVASLVPQLEIIIDGSGDPDYALLARATSLLLLPLPYYAEERLDMLAKLPSLPPFLHASMPLDDVSNYLDAHQELVEALEDLLETKKSGLRVILVNNYETTTVSSL